jgi:hypothetical protein
VQCAVLIQYDGTAMCRRCVGWVVRGGVICCVVCCIHALRSSSSWLIHDRTFFVASSTVTLRIERMLERVNKQDTEQEFASKIKFKSKY